VFALVMRLYKLKMEETRSIDICLTDEDISDITDSLLDEINSLFSTTITNFPDAERRCTIILRLIKLAYRVNP
jgi:hypothetical protein